MAQPIRVGVVGCGEVAQIIHLPTLRDLSGLFQVTALCDVIPMSTMPAWQSTR
jgi:predicted dehydrogenase